MEKELSNNESLVQRYFYIIIGLTVIFWAFAFPLIKIGLDEGLSPVNLTILRLFIGCSIFFIFYLFNKKKFSKLQKKDIIPIFLLGFIGIVIYHLSLNYGEQYVSPSVASLIIATIPIFIVILAAVFLKEKTTLKILLGIIISLFGVVIISIAGTPNASFEIKYISAAAAVLVASVVGAIYTIAGKKLLKSYTPLSLTVYAFLLGFFGLIPFIRLSLFEEILNLSFAGGIALIFLGLFPTFFAYIFWYVTLEVKTASELSIYVYLIPVVSTVISHFMINEKITIFFFLGGILVLAGLFLVNKKNNFRKL